MVMAGDSRADRRRIRIGRRNTDQVEILGGLSPGDRVITSDYARIREDGSGGPRPDRERRSP